MKEIIENVKLVENAPLEEPARQYYFMEKAKEYVAEMSEKLGRPLVAVIATFGCQMNARDSEKLLGILEKIGYVEGTDEETADFVIYNTCTVRENANLRVYGRLGQLGAMKKKNPHKMIALCGCMMQEPEVVEKLKKSYRFVDLIFGTHNIYKFAELIVTCFESERMVIDIWKDTDKIVEDLPTDRKYSFKSGVNIMFGCNNFCSYCIVPYVRGRERSRNPKDIIREIEKLVADGVVEVMLLGQNVNAYGKDLYDDYNLGDLLEDIALKDIPRIRFMTSHPWDFTDKMVEVIGKYPNIMPSVHLPVQSGSSRILKFMGRRYTRESYLELFDKIKSNVPGVSISTDIIVGFPGETEEDFQETLSLAEYCKYDNAFTFIFSAREGTPACKLKDEVDIKTKEERLYRLNDVVNKYFLENNKKLEGSVLKVLVEGVSEKKDMYYGYSETNKLINFTGKNISAGDIVDVKITSAKTWSLDGELV